MFLALTGAQVEMSTFIMPSWIAVQSCLFVFYFFSRLYPRHASALNNLGTLTHDAEEAELYYRKAVDLNPQHNRALFNLGNLLK